MLKGSKIMSFRPGSNPDIFLETALRNLRRTADVLRAVRAMPQQ